MIGKTPAGNRLIDFMRDKAAMLFPLAYFILGAMNFNSLTAQRIFVTAGAVIIIVWAVITAAFSVPFTLAKNRTAFMLLALLFFISYGISAALNIEYGVVGNLKGLLWMGVCLFLIYPAAGIEKHKGCRIGEYVLKFFVLYTAVQALAGIMTMIFIWNKFRQPNIYLGFYYGRLWGLYTDPNYGGVLSAAALLVSALLIMSGKKLFGHKWPLYIHIALQYLYIAFAYSRTAEFALYVGTAVFVLYLALRRGTRVWVKLVVSVVAIVMSLSFNFIREGYNTVAELYNGEPETTLEWEYPTTMGELERDEDVGTDLSEGRMKIWEAGIDTFLESPVFGVSYRNILPYLTENIPDSYMVTHNEPLNTFHNVFIDVLASQGAVGMLILLAALGVIAVKSVKIFKGLSGEELDGAVLYGMPILIFMAGAMTLSDLFYINSPSTVMFWYMLGHWMSFEKDIPNRKVINEK